MLGENVTLLDDYLADHFRALFLVTIGLCGIVLIAGCRTDASNPVEPGGQAPSTEMSSPTAVPTTPPAPLERTPPPTAETIVPDSAGELPDVIQDLRNALIAELDLPPSRVRVLSFQEQQWSSTALGCPEPGRSYAQIVTSGYEVEIVVGGETRIFHLSLDGRPVDCTTILR